jgi:hypothetical protein
MYGRPVKMKTPKSTFRLRPAVRLGAKRGLGRVQALRCQKNALSKFLGSYFRSAASFKRYKCTNRGYACAYKSAPLAEDINPMDHNKQTNTHSRSDNREGLPYSHL